MEIFLKKKIIMNRFPVIFLIFVCFTLFVNESHSAGEAEKIKDVDFSFEGPFGTFDRNQLQRGLQKGKPTSGILLVTFCADENLISSYGPYEHFHKNRLIKMYTPRWKNMIF